MSGSEKEADEFRRAFLRDLHSRFPRLGEALLEDARVNALNRGERHEFASKRDAIVQMLRLVLVSDAYIGQVAYRLKASLQRAGIPLLPRIMHRIAMSTAQVSIGDPVLVHPGIYVVHGQIVVDGIVEIHSGVTIAPFVTVGLRAGSVQGPTIERDVKIGTGAKVLGPITVGAGARIGANAVVIHDVAPGETVVGSPARPLVARAAD